MQKKRQIQPHLQGWQCKFNSHQPKTAVRSTLNLFFYSRSEASVAQEALFANGITWRTRTASICSPDSLQVKGIHLSCLNCQLPAVAARCESTAAEASRRHIPLTAACFCLGSRSARLVEGAGYRRRKTPLSMPMPLPESALSWQNISLFVCFSLKVP